MNPQFKKGILELCVLKLVKDDDTYGYELVERISQKFEISEGTIYPILRRLTEEKYFETYLKESPSGPPRKYYRITALGSGYQERLLKEWKEFDTQVNSILDGAAR